MVYFRQREGECAVKRSIIGKIAACLCLLALALGAAPHALAASDRMKMLSNLDVWFSANYRSKKAACIGMAETLLDNRYEPAFVAGVLANIACEGTFGIFENVWGYTPQRLLQVYPGLANAGHSHNYIAHMKGFAQYDSCGHSHSEYGNFSGKLVYNGMSLAALGNMLYAYQAEGWKAKFGMGSIQWSAVRALTLYRYYREAAGTSDNITYAQCMEAEKQCVLYELTHTRTTALTAWRSRNGDRPNTEESAYDAGYYFCYYYETPASYKTVSVTRGNLAVTIYQAMIQGTSLDGWDLTGLQLLTLPAGTQYIEAEAFMGIGCEAVVFPAGCLSIGRRAFAGCERLRYAIIPDDVVVAPDAFDVQVQIIRQTYDMHGSF